VSSFFYGLALIIAVGLTLAQKKLAVRRRIKYLAALRTAEDERVASDGGAHAGSEPRPR
jgi:hypothetical protein